MSRPNMNTLMKRLEAATSRLEDLANFYEDGEAQLPPAKPKSNSVDKSAEDESKPKAKDHDKSDKPKTEKADKAVKSDKSDKDAKDTKDHDKKDKADSKDSKDSKDKSAKKGKDKSVLKEMNDRYKTLDSLDKKLGKLVKLTEKVDPELCKQVKAFRKANTCANDIAAFARLVAKPPLTNPEYAALFGTLNKNIEVVNTIRDANRDSKLFNHFKTVAEGSIILGWVGSPKPAEYVSELQEGSQFFANKVLKDYKDPEHREWVKAFLDFASSLESVLKSELPGGLEWDPNGKKLSDALKEKGNDIHSRHHKDDGDDSGDESGDESESKDTKSKSTNPDEIDPKDTTSETKGGTDALFAEINQGTGIHNKLKHIDRKNPPKPAESKPKPHRPFGKLSAPKPEKPEKPMKPSNTVLANNSWTIENYRNTHDIVVEVEMVQTVFIDNCENCTIIIKNKGTSVTLSNCKKVGVMVDTLVSSLDILGCSDCRAQTNGHLPSLMLDKSNNLEIYLNEESLGVDIRTVNTWSINLEIPTGEPGDYTEVPLAEQISHSVNPQTKKVTAVAVAPGQ